MQMMLLKAELFLNVKILIFYIYPAFVDELGFAFANKTIQYFLVIFSKILTSYGSSKQPHGLQSLNIYLLYFNRALLPCKD